jgi:putative ABC transport system substrate-binding protein
VVAGPAFIGSFAGVYMKRREFIALLGAAVAWPFEVSAQQPAGMRSIGVLMPGNEADPESQTNIVAFRQGFADLGWKDGVNVHIETRWGGGKIELIRKYAAELVALTPDVILGRSTPVIQELSRITTSIPIVFAMLMDPVGLGRVKSLAHPGGNVTGFSFVDVELIGKWLGLLRDVMPNMTRAALIYNPKTGPIYPEILREIESARQPGATELVGMPIDAPGEIEAAIDALAQKPGSSLVVAPDTFNIVNVKQIAQLALQEKLPAISVYRQFVTEGGLLAYGLDTADVLRRSAAYVDRILKGTKPADLPVQAPIKLELTINLKTAKALGITISPNLLVQAEQVIE